MRNSLLLLACFLSFGKCAVAQNAVSVYSRGAVINQVAETNNKLYIATFGKGVVVYDMPTGTYQTMDITNSPMTSNVAYTAQALGGDTQLITSATATWLVENGLWTNINSSDTSTIAISDNGRIFQVSGETNGPLYELKNGAYQPVTDSFVAGYNFRSVVPGNNNTLYFGIVTSDSFPQSLVYKNGAWSLFNDFVIDSSWGLAYMSNSFTDNNGKFYSIVNNDNSHYHFYELDSAGWTQLPLPNLPTNLNLQTYSVLTDTGGDPLLFYNLWSDVAVPGSNGTQTFDSVNSFVWNPVTQQLTQLPHNIFPHGISDQIYSYNGNYFIPDIFYGIEEWNLAANTFTPVNYANIGLLDYDLGNSVQPTCNGVERDDSLYVIDGFGDLYVIDTSLGYSRLLVTTDRFSATNESLCKDNYGNVWVLDDTHRTANNITNGNVMSLPDSNLTTLFVYDSMAWVGKRAAMELVVNNTVQIRTTFTAKLAGMDKYGNLWGDIDSGIISRVGRLDKSGNIEIVKSWNLGSNISNYQYPEAVIDQKGNAWVLSNDTLTRYSGDSALTTFTIIKPHTSNVPYGYLGVFDSTEIVLVSANAIEYYRNGHWSYYDTKFNPYYMVYAFSFHDHRLVFFTQEDGMIEYNLDGNFDNSGNHVGGIVFHDLNGNHIQDSTDVPLTNIPVLLSGNSNMCSTNSFGKYGLDVADGNYTIKPQPLPYYISYPDSFNVNISNNIIDTLNFACYAPQPVNDVSISITACPFLIGYGGYMNINVRNNGTDVATPTVTLNYDSVLSLVFSSAPVISQSQHSVTVQISTLYPMEETNTVLSFVRSGTIDSASWLHFQATVYPLVGDSTPQNNTDTATVFTLGSFDPNYKSVQPQGAGIYNSVDTDQTLTYTIGFQNTGTAQAINIMLVDTLDARLDLSTFKYISGSHPNSYQLWGRVLTIHFKNVNLPDSSDNEAASIGYFKFSISPVHPVQINQPVVNRAYIYFDYNTPVVTNAAIVSFGTPVYASISDPYNNAPGTIMVWPQPCVDELNIYLSPQIQMPATLKLFDLSGKLLIKKTVTDNREILLVNNLSAGIYVLNVLDSNNKSYRFKCIKER